MLPASALAAPETTIGSGPTGTIADNTPTFEFSSDDPAATFECRIDADPFGACTGPGDTHTTAALSDGPHTFEVQATDSADNTDPTPASRSFSVDTAAPETTIDSGPTGTIADNTPTFEFSSDDPAATFECRIDADPFGACTGPGDTHTTAALSDGPHTFEVQATDSADNTDPTPASRSFSVDTAAPETTIDSGPTGTIADNTPTFEFSSDDPAATFECRIDADPFGACTGPGDTHTTAALSDGPHTFEVQATDSADNTDPTPASRSFSVDTAAPETTIDSGPTGTIADNTPTFEFSSDDPAATFECRIDADPFGACTGPGDTHTTAALSDGPHTFEVQATDSADNTDPTPASRSFSIDTAEPPDTTGPDTTITKRPKSEIKTGQKMAKVKVAFTSEQGATYKCRLDKAKYRRCTSPYTVKARSKAGNGKRHTISVRATDAAGNAGMTAVVKFKVLRNERLQAPVAKRTVIAALRRHSFAHRVVKSVHTDCRRISRTVFRCKFSGHFPGYRLKGRGKVKLRQHLSYRFRVKAQGLRFTLTDENEARRRGVAQQGRPAAS